MMRTALRAVVVAALALAAQSAAAQGTTDEESRYTFYRTDDGYLRLEARTGQVSLCARRPAGWICQMVPDERAALDAEIARLQNENVALKKELLSHNVPLPGWIKPDAPPSDEPRLRTPKAPELNRVIGLIEQVWRRLVEMIVSVQKDLLKQT